MTDDRKSDERKSDDRKSDERKTDERKEVKDRVTQDLAILLKSCRVTADSFSEAQLKIEAGEHMVKIPGQKLTDISYLRKDGSMAILADLMTNFRSNLNRPLGHVETKKGTVAIPIFWPNTVRVQNEWGHPIRGADLIVDAFLLSDYWNNKISENVTGLPFYDEWSDGMSA